MTHPVADPRPFAEVLADWQLRHGLTDYAVAKLLGAGAQRTISMWRAGGRVTYEPALRMAMAYYDDANGGV